MLNREINIREYVPAYIMEYKEFEKVLETENPEMQLMQSNHMKVIDNRYILTTDTDGIARFESILGITPLNDDTLENRQFRVLSTWGATIPYSYKFLESRLKMLCGEGYEIVIDFAGQTLLIKLGLDNKNNFNSVKEILDEIVPCNLITTVIIMYNTNEILSTYTHAQLSAYTHEYLKEGEL